MPLPTDFNPTEHLQDLTKKTLNRMVGEFFRDQPDLDDLDINTPRGALKLACWHRDDDPMAVTLQRSILFHLTLGQIASAFPANYGTPVTTFDESRQYKPQIRLYFLEDDDLTEAGYSRVEGEVSFRIYNERTETITKAELTRLGQKIKTEFGGAGGWEWRKGKIYCTYTDRDKGYKLQLLCRDKAVGKTLVEKVLDIQNHSPDWANFKSIETENPTAAYPTIPASKTILGKSRRLPRRRPTASVRFRHASAFIWAIQKPVLLYDRTGWRRDALVSR